MTQNRQINCGIFPTIYVRIVGLGLTYFWLGLGSLAVALTPLALLTSLYIEQSTHGHAVSVVARLCQRH